MNKLKEFEDINQVIDRDNIDDNHLQADDKMKKGILDTYSYFYKFLCNLALIIERNQIHNYIVSDEYKDILFDLKKQFQGIFNYCILNMKSKSSNLILIYQISKQFCIERRSNELCIIDEFLYNYKGWNFQNANLFDILQFHPSFLENVLFNPNKYCYYEYYMPIKRFLSYILGMNLRNNKFLYNMISLFSMEKYFLQIGVYHKFHLRKNLLDLFKKWCAISFFDDLISQVNIHYTKKEIYNVIHELLKNLSVAPPQYKISATSHLITSLAFGFTICRQYQSQNECEQLKGELKIIYILLYRINQILNRTNKNDLDLLKFDEKYIKMKKYYFYMLDKSSEHKLIFLREKNYNFEKMEDFQQFFKMSIKQKYKTEIKMDDLENNEGRRILERYELRQKKMRLQRYELREKKMKKLYKRN